MDGTRQKICFCTVTSMDFVPGTRVLVHSFLKNNAWFRGDIVIITDEKEAVSNSLFLSYPRVIFRKPEDSLLLRVGFLCKTLPEIISKRRRFYSIEAFNLDGYDRVFFFDSDMLITGDISGLLSVPGPLLACSDQPGRFEGMVRDKQTFKRITPDAGADASGHLRSTFNAGFIVIAKSLITPNHYQQLLAMVHPDIFNKVLTHNTDQVVFNILFDCRVTLLPFIYNIIVSKWVEMKALYGFTTSDIRVLHFTGNYKPWLPASGTSKKAGEPEIMELYEIWKAYERELLTSDRPC